MTTKAHLSDLHASSIRNLASTGVPALGLTLYVRDANPERVMLSWKPLRHCYPIGHPCGELAYSSCLLIMCAPAFRHGGFINVPWLGETVCLCQYTIDSQAPLQSEWSIARSLRRLI